MNWFLITVGYSGLSPKAPGTAGSLVALILGMGILLTLGSQTLFLAMALATLVGIKMIDTYEQESGIHDDKRIVIDELAGMWLALCIAPGIDLSMETLMHFENGAAVQVILAFLFFRFFDITKPSYIGRIDRDVSGGKGVMGDDLLAGVAAGISAALCWQGWIKIAAFFTA